GRAAAPERTARVELGLNGLHGDRKSAAHPEAVDLNADVRNGDELVLFSLAFGVGPKAVMVFEKPFGERLGGVDVKEIIRRRRADADAGSRGGFDDASGGDRVDRLVNLARQAGLPVERGDVIDDVDARDGLVERSAIAEISD